MNDASFVDLNELIRIVNQQDVESGDLETFLVVLRRQLVFDNVAVYMFDEQTASLEIAYARAVGRGKTAEADAAWGENIAAQVIEQKKQLMEVPGDLSETQDRVNQPYMIGLPLLQHGEVKGALVFVRFGGPAFIDEHIQIASIATGLLSIIFERESRRQVSEQLDDMKRQLQLQDDFVSTISHELRTPLGFIKGYSTSLLREDTSWDSETQKEFLTVIDEETDRLSLLIENVLESARLQSKTLPLRFQPLRLDAVLRDVSTRVRVRNKELDINLDLQSSITIHGDGVRLAQVFENLFTNAMKYAEGSPIFVGLKQIGNSMIISFMDQGPGIPADALPLIFERFYRVRTEKASGTGLGLFICKHIIEAHRGKIWAESNPDQGTTFFIELPVNP